MKMKKTGALCLATILSASAFTACGGGGGLGGVDPSLKKTASILNVKIFKGGLGYAWLEELANEFMDTFKDVEFEEGKKGVYISITPNKQFTSLHDNMASGADAQDIYYTSTSDLNPFLRVGVAYDVTKIMTSNVYDATGNVKLNAKGDGWEIQQKSMADRINVDYYKDAFNLGTEENPSYYSLPYEDNLSGIIVDWDLFKEESWNTYSGLDGMPGTFTEFKDLLLKIQAAGYSAFTYSPSVGYYTPSIQRAVQAKVDGVDWYNDVSCDYTSEYDFNNDGQITEDEKITPSTMWKTLDTNGVEAAIKMAEVMFDKPATGNTYYDSNVVQGVTFGGAQQDFVMSKASNNRPRIAMILEGEWWENETRATFNSMGRLNEANGYGKREFRFMPIPKMTNNDKTQEYTIGSFSNGSVTVVNQKTVGSNSVKQKLAELWLQFQYSAKGLKCFTMHTSASLPLEYDLTEAEWLQMTPFGRNTWDLKHNDDVKIVYNSPMMLSDQLRFGSQGFGYSTNIGGSEYTGELFNNYVTFNLKNMKVSSAEYIQGMHTYYNQRFEEAYSNK